MTTVTSDIHHFSLRTSLDHSGPVYAFYPYLDGEIVDRQPYQPNDAHEFTLTQAGVYRVRGYVRDTAGVVEARTSKSVRFDGSPKVPAVSQPTMIQYWA